MGGSKSINLFLAKIFGLSFFWLISENWLSHVVAFYHHFWIYIYHILLVILLKLSVFVFSFTDYSILHGYDTLSIVGSSGAGKTTLLQILGTLDNPDNGILEIAHIRSQGWPFRLSFEEFINK